MVWEYFNDGRPPQWHTHPIKKVKGVRPRPPGPLTRLVRKQVWNAAPQVVREENEVIPLEHPVHTVRLTYTDTWACENPEECKRLVWELQENHIHKYTFDIMWNFLIAPDGTVYEGRGWDIDGHRPEKYDKLKGHCIDIAYIGNYIAKSVPKPMTEAAHDVIDWGVNNGKILCCHDIISHRDPQVDDGYNPDEVFDNYDDPIF